MPVDFGAAVKAPPTRNRKTAAAAAPSIPVPVSQREVRESGLNGLAQLGQGLLIMGGQFADAATVGRHFPNTARELATLADQYEQLAKPIDIIIQLGPFGALLAAGMPLVMQILANHKVIDASSGLGGVVPPEMLEAQMKSEIVRMQAEQLRAQQEAMREMQAAQADLNSLLNGGANDGTPVQG